jgi:hypothetical protein
LDPTQPLMCLYIHDSWWSNCPIQNSREIPVELHPKRCEHCAIDTSEHSVWMAWNPALNCVRFEVQWSGLKANQKSRVDPLTPGSHPALDVSLYSWPLTVQLSNPE